MFRTGILVVAAVLLLATGFALGRHHPPADAAQTPLYWVDPMHPSFRSDKPGKAPDCGMDLVPVYAKDVAATLASADTHAASLADPAVRSFYGVELTTVSQHALHATLHLIGQVQPEDTRLFRVSIGTDGYVKDTANDAVGARVTKNQKLATIYSPEFLSLTGGYLSANERMTPMQAAAAHENAAPTQNAASAQARADRLRALGMSDVQINEIARLRRIPEDVYVVSPADGLILARHIAAGMHFDKMTDFYTVADLSHVWIATQLTQRDAGSVHPGMAARLSFPGTHQAFTAHVTSAPPEVDPTTHTLLLRLEADNPHLALRPDMTVNVDLDIHHRPGLTVPVDAVIDSGDHRQVYVEDTDGHFAPRLVHTGWTDDNDVEILDGLSSGERVVSSGTFLIDSETRLHARPVLSAALHHPGAPR